MPDIDEYLSDRKTYPDETEVTLASGDKTTLGRIRAGYMKDADYRKKTSEVARQREELERDYAARMAAVKDAENKLQEMAIRIARSNPDLNRDEVAETLQSDPVAKRIMDRIDQLEGVMKPLVQTVVTIDKHVKDRDTERFADQHRAVLAQLKAKDPKLDEDELLDYAKKNLIVRLDKAYIAMKHDDLVAAAVKEAEEKAFKRGQDQAKKDAATAPVLPLRRAPALAKDAPKTLEAAVEAAYSDPEIMNPLLGIEG